MRQQVCVLHGGAGFIIMTLKSKYMKLYGLCCIDCMY